MITRIELTNFMSHAHTVIEPAPGLTVLVGPNNCGKSAVVAALQILAHNDNSTYVRRHETSECVVEVHTDDGHIVRWSRKKSGSPKYLIDGEAFDRLGQGGVPDKLPAALRLLKVDGGDDSDFDVHFGAQKTPIFLIGSSAANAARFFASSSDAIRLVQMQQRHKAKLAERQREKVRLEAESKQLNAELETLQPAVELDRRVKAAEHGYDEVLRLADRIVAAQRDLASLKVQAESARQQATRAAALQSLAPPPPLHDTAAIDQAAQAVARHEQFVARGRSIAASLQPLATPPDLADTKTLQQLLRGLALARIAAEEWAARSSSLAELPPAPQLGDERGISATLSALSSAAGEVSKWRATAEAATPLREPPPAKETAPLADLLREFEKARATAAACEGALASAQEQLTQAADDLRELAETANCPTCGAPFDADRLLAAAGAAGLGGHAHG